VSNRHVGSPLDRPTAEARASQLSAVAEPVRLRLLSMVLHHPDGRIRSGELAAQFRQSAPTISHHLRVLTEAGLLERERVGTAIYYRPTHIAVAHLSALLTSTDDDTESSFPAVPVLESALADPAEVLARISAPLADRFAGTFSPETVNRYVAESYRMLAERSRIHRFLPSLTASFAADRLAALARANGSASTAAADVLFVCVRNAGRSQMAAALLLQRAGGRITVRSAGSNPIAALDANVMNAMDEIGVYLGGSYPKPLTDEVVRAADVVVTMGCGDACPVYPGKRYLDWPIDDPAGKNLESVRAIRDAIASRVNDLVDDLLTPA
jgi:ArsR family transcriptional regulator